MAVELRVDEFSMGLVELEEPSLPPVLVEFRGEVVGVTFTEGREAVAAVAIRDLDGDHGRVITTATATQVDTAIRMRRERIPVIVPCVSDRARIPSAFAA
jgi:hypothetical protein